MPEKSRAARKREGIALIEAGSTVTAAAAEVGLPLTTLYEARRKWLATAEDSEARTALQDALIAQKVEIAALADAELLRRLQDEKTRQALSTNQLNVLAGTALDKIAMKERWNQQRGDASAAGEGIAAFLRALERSEAIEVTVQSDPESE